MPLEAPGRAVSLLRFISMQPYTEQLSIQQEQPVLPVLTIKEVNPALKRNIIRQVNTAYSLQEVTISLEGTTELSDIESVGLFLMNEKRVELTRQVNASCMGIINTNRELYYSIHSFPHLPIPPKLFIFLI